MAIPILPSDLIIIILTRLPSKTLIRFKSVSKQWYSLINSPNFINLHLTQTLISDNNSPNLIICQSCLFSSLISDDYTNPNFYFSKVDHPLEHLSDTTSWFPQILGSVNGVVCISSYDKSSIILYNPSTKTHRFIPPFTPSPDTNPLPDISNGSSNANLVIFGFGFDSVKGDYKVLRIIETRKNNALAYREASVYSLRNDSWKCLNDQTLLGQFYFQYNMGVFVNEVLHFIVIDSKLNPKVKCFDLRTETFSFLDLPKFDDKFSRKRYSIKELGGCFSVMVNYQKEVIGLVAYGEFVRADLWVMKEYGNEESWFRLFSICDLSNVEVSSHMRPVVYSRDKERVLLQLDGLYFGWYSWGNKRFKIITVHGLPSSYAPFETSTLSDSLVSLEKDKDEDKVVS
ncbi:hypothetical protein KSS87_003473 [Heliosperma pusillum]|nr:hypothetical protein KSS87_003473 [Heliosperma pusillum]